MRGGRPPSSIRGRGQNPGGHPLGARGILQALDYMRQARDRDLEGSLTIDQTTLTRNLSLLAREGLTTVVGRPSAVSRELCARAGRTKDTQWGQGLVARRWHRGVQNMGRFHSGKERGRDRARQSQWTGVRCHCQRPRENRRRRVCGPLHCARRARGATT